MRVRGQAAYCGLLLLMVRQHAPLGKHARRKLASADSRLGAGLASLAMNGKFSKGGFLCGAQAEVRRLAAQAGLPNQARPDSQGICFLGKARPPLPSCTHTLLCGPSSTQ